MTRRQWKWSLGSVLVMAVAGLAVAALLGHRDEVTTDSDEARAAFQRATDSFEKLYRADGMVELGNALKADPEFPMANCLMAELTMGSGRAELARSYIERAVRQRDRVTEKERFKIDICAAFVDKKTDHRRRLLEQYRATFPTDVWGLFRAASDAWDSGDGEQARRLFQQVLEIDPNHAQAYNMLGYLAARDRRFQEAEGYFLKYTFIAGKEANPHDSLGELLLHTGRYDEAEKSFQKALEIKPTFWASSFNLALLDLKRGHLDAAKRRVEQLLETVDAKQALELRIFLINLAYREKDPAAVRAAMAATDAATPADLRESESYRRSHGFIEVAALLLEKRLDEARRRLDELRATLPPTSKTDEHDSNPELQLHEFEGHFALASGDYEAAVKEYEAAFGKSLDKGLVLGRLPFIFYARTYWAIALARSGRAGEAAVVLSKHLEIDPRDRVTLEALETLDLTPTPAVAR